MLKHLTTRDKAMLATLLISSAYFIVMEFSGCEWVNAPLAFVRGCHNYGIDWNASWPLSGLS